MLTPKLEEHRLEMAPAFKHIAHGPCERQRPKAHVVQCRGGRAASSHLPGITEVRTIVNKATSGHSRPLNASYMLLIENLAQQDFPS